MLMSSRQLVLTLCLAEILVMTGFASFPALMPFFFDHWRMSGTEAGWINGVFFFGFMLCGPALISLTDRIDARPIFLAGCLLSLIGAVGFAWAARDFWSSLPWRFFPAPGWRPAICLALKC